MSTLSQFTSGIRLQQKGTIYGVSFSTSSGEDAQYYNITLGTAVTDISKCILDLSGPCNAASGYRSPKALTLRLTSTTNLRISNPYGTGAPYGMAWTVTEFY